MGKTTNILDLNNRLEKVEKENVAQNNYNSLKNRPKINGNLLTGDKTGSQLGLAEAQEVGNLSDLNTTDKSSCVGAINEVNGKIGNLSTGTLRFYPIVAQNNIAAVTLPKANSYSIVSLTILGNSTEIPEATGGVTDGYVITAKSATDGYLHIGLVGSYGSGNVNKGNCLNLLLDIT